MLVKDIINALSKYDDNAEVRAVRDTGYSLMTFPIKRVMQVSICNDGELFNGSVKDMRDVICFIPYEGKEL